MQYSEVPPDGMSTCGSVPQINIRSARAAVRGRICAHVSGVVVALVGGTRLCSVIGCGIWRAGALSNSAASAYVRGRASSSSTSAKLFWRMQESSWCDLVQSCSKVTEETYRLCVGLISAFSSSSMMSTNKSSGDRSDVPDLLKSLADYPFSFPDFEDTGKFFFTCGKYTFGTVYIINQKCVILTVTMV